MKSMNEIATPLITLEDITVRIRDRFILPHTSWTIKTGEQWRFSGPMVQANRR